MLPSRLFIVRQNFPDLRLADVGAGPAPARAQRLRARLRPGARVAIGVGSRGIANIAASSERRQYWRAHGMSPFVPRHGKPRRRDPEGQAAVLAHFGMTEQSMGCPIVSRADVVSLGQMGEDGSKSSWMPRRTRRTPS